MKFSISRPPYSRWLNGYPYLRKDPLMRSFGSEVKELRFRATSELENKAIRSMARILNKALGKNAVRVERPEERHFYDLVLFFIDD